MAEPPPGPPTAQEVANFFVRQYYYIRLKLPEEVYRFYQKSRTGRPSSRGADMDTFTTTEAIKGKARSMDIVRAEIIEVDAQESLSGGVIVLVTGYLTGRDEVRREFAQSIFLAPQEGGYFVLNNMFGYVGDGDVAADSVATLASEASPQNAQVAMANSDAPVPHEEAPKKTNISNVKLIKGVSQTISTVTCRRAPPKPGSSNIQKPKGHGIYIDNLPFNTLPVQLKTYFERFGAIIHNCTAVKSNKNQGFCYGLVVFEDATGIQNAVEHSPMMFLGQLCNVEERTTDWESYMKGKGTTG